MLLYHHVYHLPKTAMYVHKYFCSDNSVVRLNKNVYIFNSVLGYITNTSSM